MLSAPSFYSILIFGFRWAWAQLVSILISRLPPLVVLVMQWLIYPTCLNPCSFCTCLTGLWGTGRHYLLTPSQFAFDLITSLPLSLVEMILYEVTRVLLASPSFSWAFTHVRHGLFSPSFHILAYDISFMHNWYTNDTGQPKYNWFYFFSSVL